MKLRAVQFFILLFKELEYLCLDRDTQAFKRQSAIKFAELVYDGKWFTPLQ